jgi:hypothetical protein
VNHADDVYRLLNPKTKHNTKSRDVVWLWKIYAEWSTSKADSNFKDDDSDNETDDLGSKSVKDKIDQYFQERDN